MNDSEKFSDYYDKYLQFYDKLTKQQLVDIIAWGEANKIMMSIKKVKREAIE